MCLGIPEVFAALAFHLGVTFHIRIKSGEQGFPGFSVPGRLCKPEGAA